MCTCKGTRDLPFLRNLAALLECGYGLEGRVYGLQAPTDQITFYNSISCKPAITVQIFTTLRFIDKP
jgi:hypothetical protein